ncbi:MAG: Xaa-Pro peptidase family protein [Gemmatimonadota bacterium]
MLPCTIARRTLPALLALALGAAPAAAQYYQTDFPAEEFQARWSAVYDAIGDDAVAVVQGMPRTDGYIFPRQYNTFYYLSGVEVPGAYMVLDGGTRRATLFLPPRDERLARAEGLELSAQDGEFARRAIGVDSVASTEDMSPTTWPIGAGGDRPVIYAELSPAEGHQQSRGELRAAETARVLDPWDGGTSRQRRFVELLRARQPRSEIRDLNPVLDELRSIKSPREIALIRRACQLAGFGVTEAMRSTERGVYEYQLDAAARYMFNLHGARLDGYRPITASGTENINRLHYFRNLEQLKDGDLVLMDFAPDYRYYVCDIGRVWPVSGTYRDETQRELIQFILEYHKAVMSRIRPGVTADQIMAEAAEAMETVFARTRFSKPIYEAAARTLVQRGGGVFSHTVGMAVHDVGSYRSAPLMVGQVFSVDPQLRVPEESLYLRYEDTVVVTPTGVENFTDFMPMELADMERTVREQGVVQKVPVVF